MAENTKNTVFNNGETDKASEKNTQKKPSTGSKYPRETRRPVSFKKA